MGGIHRPLQYGKLLLLRADSPSPYQYYNNQLIIMEWMDANGMPGVENGRVLHLIP